MILRLSRRNGGALFFAACTFSLTIPTIAANAQDGVSEKRDEIIVRATRIPTELGRTGSSVSVIDDIKIEQQQSRFVIDVLQTTPGLSISQFGSRGTDSSVRLRGQGAEGTLVLVDGVEVSDPSRSQTAFDFSQLLSGNIDRIEVLRGSQSVLYGGDAVGGVVNIITKRGEGDLTGSLLAEYGSFNTFLGASQVRGGLADDMFGYSVNLQYLQTNGFSAADEALAGNNEGEDYDNLSSSGRFDLALIDGLDLSAVYRYAEGTLNYDACGGPFCDDIDVGDDYLQYSGRASAAFSLLDDALSGEFGVAYSRNERDGFDNGAPNYFFIGERLKVDGHLGYNFSDDQVVIIGAETENEAYESDGDPIGADVDINGYYALYQGTFFDALTVSLGGRLDDHQIFGTYDTYRGTVAYNFPTGTKLKGSYSTGFRAPSLFELYGICCGDPNLGNPDLDPEESKSWDVGLEQTLLGGSLYADVVYFNVRTENEIVFGGAFGTPAPNYFNVTGTTKSEGVETSLAWQVSEAVDIGGTYTYNLVKSEAGIRLQNRPRHAASAYVNWIFAKGRGNLNVSGFHFSDSLDSNFGTSPATIVKLNANAIIKVAASYDLTEQVEVSARVENLLNESYQTEFGYGTADVSAFGGVRFNF